jgi:hypothetical protein
MDFGKSRKFLGDDLRLTKKLKSQTEEKVEVGAKKKEEAAKEMEMEVTEETKNQEQQENPPEEKGTNAN